MSKHSPLVLMILDGWGYSSNNTHNAIAKAHTPQWDEWWHTCPHLLLSASGSAVGLPLQQMGNSEVGHMHMGAGRIIQQDFTKINHSIECGEFARNPVLNKVIEHVQETTNSLHIMGLFSSGGVHSHEQHLFELLDLCKQKQFESVYLHLFLDGRDTPPQSALHSLKLLQAHSKVTIKSISGRYYAMDRDKRWERIVPVYDLITQGISEHHFKDAETAINAFYAQKIFDEFIPPTLIGTAKPLKKNDALLFFNFRADRARQLTAAFTDPNFDGFQRTLKPTLSYFVSMTQYDKNLPTTIAFPSLPLTHTLGEVIANSGLTQLRIAETEKYAHVTFFFNGGSESVFANEERIMIPSPKVATYDLKPEMSAQKLTDTLIDAINSKNYDVIICNYANADMVGHTGNFKATVQAIECLDSCMQQVCLALSKLKGTLIITADHGNAEQMHDEESQQAHTAHTSEPVPFIYVGEGWQLTQAQGSLIDIAPTILTLLGIDPPIEMTGRSLLEKNNVS